MKNCLVTKLKSAVPNNNLRKLGYLYLYVDFTGVTDANKRAFSVSATEANVVEVFDNIPDFGHSLGVAPTNDSWWPRAGENATVIYMSNREKIRRIESSDLGTINTNTPDLYNQLSYCTGLELFKPVGTGNLLHWDGMIETYAGMFNNGRRSGELSCTLKVTINENVVQSPTAVFGENDVKVYNTDKSTLLATYDGIGWSYPS